MPAGPRATLTLAFAAAALVTQAAAAQGDASVDLAAVLQRAGERVERFFRRAESLVCREVVRLQPLGTGLTAEGSSRVVESELRVSWQPEEGEPSTEAQTLRRLIRVNGHPPRKDDWNNCTAPEQQEREPQPLSMLLPGKRRDYAFRPAGAGRVDGRAVILVDFRLLTKVTVAAEMVDGKEDCISFRIDGGMRGRLWIDQETFDVVRLDQGLSGLVEIPVPEPAARRSGSPFYWTLERWDTSIRFKPVAFADPDETLVLPVSLSSLRVTRGSGMPRLRTSTAYSDYRRFLTAGRILPH